MDELLSEYKALETRTIGLRDSLVNKELKVDNLNYDLLIGQLKAMETYLTILSIRIGLNAPKEDKVSE